MNERYLNAAQYLTTSHDIEDLKIKMSSLTTA